MSVRECGPQLAFFAADGSYGDAESLVILDVSDWSGDDWDAVSSVDDGERFEFACDVAAARSLEVRS